MVGKEETDAFQSSEMGRSGYSAVWNGMETSQYMPRKTGTVMCLWHSPNGGLKGSVLFLPQSSPACCSAELVGTQRNRNSTTFEHSSYFFFCFSNWYSKHFGGEGNVSGQNNFSVFHTAGKKEKCRIWFGWNRIFFPLGKVTKKSRSRSTSEAGTSLGVTGEVF